jgi:hypothetical protein
VTQRVASKWRTQDPIMGTRHPQALYLSLGQEVSFTPLRVGWHLDDRVLPIGITRERRMKPRGPDLTWGGGGIHPCRSYGEALALANSHLFLVIQASLISYLSIVVPILRPLAS